MKQIIKVSAPGKLILMGEHAAVYGKPALIAAIDKRCRISISPRNDNKITINSKNFKKDITSDFEKINTKFKKAEKDWEKFDKNNDVELLKSITKEPLDYPQIIIGQFINYFNLKTLGGFNLMIDSEIPVGAGMGSSAALAVSIIGALILYYNLKFDKQIINEIAFLAEQKKHGRPSGGDNSTSTHGAVVWYEKNKEVKLLNIKLSSKITKNFYVVNTGTPDESTGEMVSFVKSIRQKNPKFVNDIFDSQEILVCQLLEALKNENDTEMLRIIKEGEENLEKIGVVPSYTNTLIKEIEQSGGAAKIWGGGGKTKKTGILLIYHKNLQILKNVLKSHNLIVEQLTMGAEGIKNMAALTERRDARPVIDIDGQLQMANRRLEGAEVSEAHNETHLGNVGRLTQLAGVLYGFNTQENNLGHFIGRNHDLVRSPSEDPSLNDETASSNKAIGSLVRLHKLGLFLTTPEQREAVSYAIKNHGRAPSFFTDPTKRNDVPQELPDRLHAALFVADKMEANGVRVIARRSSFVAGDRLRGEKGDWKEYELFPDRDENNVVAMESMMRLGFINPESIYPERFKPLVSPLYATQREFVTGLMAGADLSMRDVAKLLMQKRRKSDGKNYLEVKSIGKKDSRANGLIIASDVDGFAELLAERTGVNDEAIRNVDRDTAASALDTVDYFSRNYREDLDGLVDRWQPGSNASRRWRQGMIEYANGTWFDKMQRQLSGNESGTVYTGEHKHF